ncbi:hypothetical protein [Bacillus sp. 1NLA3E]|uniref:hypothetical protein n=1 Tax=Bacillus sp. 1NLA3E TaxID=666686 RepID=UPI000247EB44|nr:hypothetical protein [Bacillus sp. 1NLA3E]AGK54467.1 hypothetical protein B1NLA3E_13595 [Bacillus sp. 1NLA3E]
MQKKYLSIASFAFFVLALLFAFFAHNISNLNGFWGSIIELILFGISLVLAFPAKGFWRVITFLGLSAVVIYILLLGLSFV